MRGEKPELNLPVCPKCGGVLTEISENYTTIAVDYKFDGKKFKLVKEPQDTLVFTCTKCGNILPDNIIDNLVKLLPKIG